MLRSNTHLYISQYQPFYSKIKKILFRNQYVKSVKPRHSYHCANDAHPCVYTHIHAHTRQLTLDSLRGFLLFFLLITNRSRSWWETHSRSVSHTSPAGHTASLVSTVRILVCELHRFRYTELNQNRKHCLNIKWWGSVSATSTKCKRSQQNIIKI